MYLKKLYPIKKGDNKYMKRHKYTNINRINEKEVAKDYAGTELQVKEICDKHNITLNQMYSVLGRYYGSKDKIPYRADRKPAVEVSMSVDPSELEEKPGHQMTLEELLENKDAIVKKEELLEKEEKERKENYKEVTEINFAGSKFSDPALIKVIGNRSIEVALVSDRHNMPYQSAIFDGPLTSEQITDYTWQEEVVRKYRRENCSKVQSEVKDFYIETLTVAVTGLQMLTGSVFKVCREMNVPLTFLHYNPSTKKYDAQEIIPAVENGDTPNTILFAKFNKGEIYFHGMTMDDLNTILESNPDFKVPCLVLNDHDEDGDYSRAVYILSLNKKSIWDLYIKAVEAQFEVTSKHSVSFMNLYLNKYGNLAFGEKVSKSFNFSTKM